MRLQLVDRAETWEQHIAAPSEFEALSVRSLPESVGSQPAAQRAAVLDIAAELTAQGDLSAALTAVYVSGRDDGGYLALSLHEIVADTTSREILIADILTAFTQRIAGQDISLPPTTTSWRDWSLRSAALATHPVTAT